MSTADHLEELTGLVMEEMVRMCQHVGDEEVERAKTQVTSGSNKVRRAKTMWCGRSQRPRRFLLVILFLFHTVRMRFSLRTTGASQGGLDRTSE